MTDKELLKQALNALERSVQHKYPYEQDAAIRLGEDAVIALTARLEQPEDEPAWVGLTDDERRYLRKKHQQHDAFAQAIEAKLKEKNNG